MIHKQTIITIIDNSGAITAKTIHIFKKPYAKINDLILVSIVRTKPQSQESSKVKKGQIHLAKVILTKSSLIRKDGTVLNFAINAAILLKQDFTPLANRIITGIPFELRNNSIISSLSPKLL